MFMTCALMHSAEKPRTHCEGSSDMECVISVAIAQKQAEVTPSGKLVGT